MRGSPSLTGTGRGDRPKGGGWGCGGSDAAFRKERPMNRSFRESGYGRASGIFIVRINAGCDPNYFAGWRFGVGPCPATAQHAALQETGEMTMVSIGEVRELAYRKGYRFDRTTTPAKWRLET